MRMSVIFLAAVAAAIQALGLPAMPAAARPSARSAADGPQAATDRTAGDGLATAQTQLAVALLEKVASGTGQATVSPASLGAALGIVSLGADPAMKAALATVSGFAPERGEAGLAALVDGRRTFASSREAFRAASRIVFAPSNPPNRIVRAGLENLGIDYAIADLSNADAAAKIDGWVKEVTNGAIPEILGGPINKSSFVALNALHFKSRWRTPFDLKLTAPSPFTGIDGNNAGVAMMRLGLGLHSFRQERHGGHSFLAIDLPFADERFALVVVTTTGKPAAARDFSALKEWLAGTAFTPHTGDLALPRFAASEREDLLPVLDALGLREARKSPTALQGFGPGIVLSQMTQRAMIDVDEEGAEAAAATAAVASRMLESEDAIHMVVDKPFVYALRDRATGLILVAGYVGVAPKGKPA